MIIEHILNINIFNSNINLQIVCAKAIFWSGLQRQYLQKYFSCN